MATKFLTLEEAAQKLGISADDLTALRERHEVHGYRDGSSWKFKVDEIDRYASERAAEAASSDSGELLDVPDDDADSADVMLVSEEALGESDPSTSSTIIGRPGTGQDPGASDIRIVTGDEPDSDVKLVPDPDSPGNSGVRLAPDVDDSSEAEAPAAGSESGLELAEDSIDLDLETDIPILEEESSSEAGADAEDDALSLVGEYAIADDSSSEADSASEIQLGAEPDAESDDEFVLEGTGSDVTLGAGDSGISLADPADSGISLADPLELGGGEVEPLDLAAADDESDFELSSDSDSEAVAEAVSDSSSDDDFLLTPLEEVSEGDSDDSGSQVIALDESDEFGASAAAALEEGADMVSLEDEGVDTAVAMDAGAAMAPRMVPEAQYTGLQVTGLAFGTLLMLICFMFMFDLLLNMWSWDEPFALNSTLMDLVLGLFGS